VEASTEGEVGEEWRVGKGKRSAKIETQESNVGKCCHRYEALNFLGMDVVAICFSVGEADTFDEHLQAVSGIHYTSSESTKNSGWPIAAYLAPLRETKKYFKDTPCAGWVSNRPKE